MTLLFLVSIQATLIIGLRRGPLIFPSALYIAYQPSDSAPWHGWFDYSSDPPAEAIPGEIRTAGRRMLNTWEPRKALRTELRLMFDIYFHVLTVDRSFMNVYPIYVHFSRIVANAIHYTPLGLHSLATIYLWNYVGTGGNDCLSYRISDADTNWWSDYIYSLVQDRIG